jgi:competence protein ComEA
VVDHGTDVDERAAAALEALRDGRGPGADRVDDPWTSIRRLVEAAGPGVRRALVVVAAVVAVVALGALAWLAVRPVGSSGGADVGLFAGSATSVPAAGATDAGGGVVAPTATTTTAVGIVVHAAGAVQHPGLYRLSAGTRVADLLDAAGGPTAPADLDRLNLAAPLADGQRLYVPRTGELAPPAVAAEGGGPTSGSVGGAGGGASPSASSPLDLNAATAEQLDTLPGVGPATAAAIVDHRQRNGPFATVDGLLDVRGIGPAKLEAIRDLVTVG